MQRRLLSHDPITGKATYFEPSPDGDSFQIITSEDQEPTLDANQRSRIDAGDDWHGDVHKVASLPMSVYWDLQKKGILNDERAFRRWLNDKDNQVFRTRGGRV